MDREIKFRAWVNSHSRWHMTDDLSVGLNGVFFHTGQSNITEPDWKLMQYTGLKDMNGTPIYEGDIVKRVDDTPFRAEDGTKKYCTWLVEFKFAQWAFTDTPISPATSYPAFYSNAQYMEVIGNIYENPELLEEIAHV